MHPPGGDSTGQEEGARRVPPASLEPGIYPTRPSLCRSCSLCESRRQRGVVSEGSHDKAPQAAWLRAAQMHCLGSGGWKSEMSVSAGNVLRQRPSGRICPRPSSWLLVSSSPSCALAWRHTTPIWLSLSHGVFPRVCLHVASLPVFLGILFL